MVVVCGTRGIETCDSFHDDCSLPLGQEITKGLFFFFFIIIFYLFIYILCRDNLK